MPVPFLVHAHIPKTGGSALNQRFVFPHFGRDRVQMLYRYVFETAHRLPARHVSPAMRCLAAAGHVPFGFYERVYPDATYVSVFRDPVDRMLSFLNFVLATSGHKIHERLGAGSALRAREDPDAFVMAVLKEPWLAMVHSNVQTRLAAGCARLGEVMVEPQHLEAAQHNIGEDTYLIGDQADLSGFVAELGERFGTRSVRGPTVQPDTRLEKRVPRRLRIEALTRTTLGALEQANGLDLRLYEHIARRSQNLAA